MKKTTFLSLVAGGALMFSLNASAIVFVEVGDAGESLDTAQMVGGGVTQITGNVNGDADMFGFYWGGGSFYANTVGSTGDTQLFLFDSSGAGIWGNDDGVSFAGPAYISDPALSAGTYYLGISSYDYDPYSASGVMFQSFPWEPLYGPSNGTETLTNWDGTSFAASAYTINFQQIDADGNPVGDPTGTGTAPTQIPEPASIALMGLGLLGLGLQHRRKNRR